MGVGAGVLAGVMTPVPLNGSVWVIEIVVVIKPVSSVGGSSVGANVAGKVGVAVGGTGVGVSVLVGVAVGVEVAVAVFVGFGVGEGVFVGVAVAVFVGVAVAFWVAVFVGVGVAAWAMNSLLWLKPMVAITPAVAKRPIKTPIRIRGIYLLGVGNNKNASEVRQGCGIKG